MKEAIYFKKDMLYSLWIMYIHQGLFCKHKDRRGSLVTKSYKWESSVTCALIEAYNHLSQYDTAGSSNEWDLKPAVREID